MSVFRPRDNNILAVTQQLLTSLSVKVNIKTTNKLLTSHPEAGSLLAIVDSLNDLSVLTELYQIDREDYEPDDFLYPFIAHFPGESKFILIRMIENGIVTFGDEKQKSNSMSEQDFLDNWGGVALRAVAEQSSGEEDYLLKRVGYTLETLRYPALILMLCIIVYYVLCHTLQPISALMIILLKLSGTALTAMLISKSFSISSSILDKVCNITGKNGCDEIANSSASRIASWLSWSEIGLFYFTGTLLGFLIIPASLPVIAYCNALVIPFAIYLIGYQFRYKTWCTVCCIIQTLIFAEFGIDIYNNSFAGSLVKTSYPLLLVCFLLPILAWSLLKPVLLKASMTESLGYYLNKFKYDTKLFHSLLRTQKSYSDVGLVTLNFGNPLSLNEILLVTNPFCPSCALVHQRVFNWLNTTKNLKIRIVFATSATKPEARAVAAHITALYEHAGPEQSEKALTSWYSGRSFNYNEWASHYPLNDDNFSNDLVEQQKTWCESQNLAYTPCIFFNGFALPEQYAIEDLRYVIG